jgi:RNA polymerase sigma-70 factor (ECF subfamily)
MSDLNFDIADPLATQFSPSRVELLANARELAGRYYQEERDSIYRYLVSLGTNPSEAQDLTQETFLKLYVALRNRNQIENIRPWLFTVASNLAMNHRRWWSYRPQAREDDVARWIRTEADGKATPEEVLLQRETASRLKEAIHCLSRQQQACLHLRAEGFRYREIAGILGVSLPTVAEFLHRAVIRLKKAMR